MRNALGALAFGLLMVTVSAYGGKPIPSLSVAWKSITVNAIEKTDVRANETAKSGVIDLDLNGGKLKFRLDGLRLEGNRLVLNQAQMDLTYAEIKGKNVLIIDIPETIKVRTERREKRVLGQRIVYDEPIFETKSRRETKETALFAFQNPGIVVEKRPEAVLGIVLPREWKLKVTSRGTPAENHLEFQGVAELIPQLHQAVDAGLTDELLAKALDYRLVNVPGEIAPFVRGKIESEKATLFPALRAALKEEMAKPSFWEGIQTELAKEIPVLDLKNQTMDGRLKLSADALPSTLELGSDTAPTFAAKSRFDVAPTSLRVATNSSGMNLVLRSFLNGLADGHKVNQDILKNGCSVDADAKVLKYAPATDNDRQDLANVFGPLLGLSLDPKELDAIGMDLMGKTFPTDIKFTGDKKLVLGTGLLVYPRSKSAAPSSLYVILTFGTDDNGALTLESMQSIKGKVTQKGTMLQSLEAALKLPIVRMLLNDRLKAAQLAGTADQAFAMEVVKEPGSEAVLVFRAR